MRIAVLGPLEVLTDDLAPVPVPGAKERLILAVLTAAAPGIVSADRLAETVWDGGPPPTARKSLQAHLVRLRSALEPDRPKGSTGRYVVRRGPGYALALDRGSIDALAFADLAARGRARLATDDLSAAERELTRSLELWHGEPYADWPDASFADTERRRLADVRRGALAALVETRLAQGRPAEVVPELQRLVAEEPLQENWWRLLMLALYRDGRQADALAAGRRVRALLAEELGADPGSALRATELAVLAQDPVLDIPAPRAPPVAEPVVPACPYKGLAAYQVADAAWFHGRARLVNTLVSRLVDVPLLVVSGPSGAGKSSLVRAGLIPALLGGGIPGSSSWRPVVLTPGDRPVDELADLTGEAPPEAPVLLVCDQFEQLWAPGSDPAERTAFIDALLGLLDDGVAARCVLVVRGDHLGRLTEHRALTDRSGGALVLVPALTEGELRDVVRAPAAAVGLTVEPELLDAVVADGLGRIGALPLLSTALVGTWERRSGHRLTLAGYLGAGGIAGALTRSAEAAWTTLDDSGREDARRLLVRLADVDDGGALVRRPVRLAELDLAGDGGSGRRAVVETFVARRLLALDGDRLEVAHEALLTGWPRLARWLEDDTAGRAVRRRLVPAALEWQDGGRPDEELYRGARLAAALDWAAGTEADLTPVEQRFLDASRSRVDAELDEARRRADREAGARRRTRRLAAGLAAVLVLALGAAGLALRAQRQAAQASLVADANRLAALSTTAASLDLSLLLAAQAVRLGDTAEAQDALLAALAGHGRAERVGGFTGDPSSAHLAGGGRTLFFGNGDQIVTWEIDASGQPPVASDFPDWGVWRAAAPSPTEDAVLGAGDDFGVPWLGIVSADGTSRLLQRGAALGGLPVGATFSPDGRRASVLVATPDPATPEDAARWSVTDVDVADGTARDTGIGGTVAAPVERLVADVADDGGSMVLWDAGGVAPALLIGLGGHVVPLATEEPAPTTLAYRALPSGAARLDDGGGVTLLDRTGRPVQRIDVHQEPVRDVAVSPDGTWAVTVGDGAAVRLWDVDPTTGAWSQREQLTGHDGDVVEVEVDPDGGRLVTVSLDHTIIAWDLRPDGGFGQSVAALDGRWIANRPELVGPLGPLVAPTRTGSPLSEERGVGPGPDTVSVAATFLDPASGAVEGQVVVGDTLPGVAFGSSVSVSPDRRQVAVTWGLGTTVLDTRTHDVVAEIVLPPTGGRDRDGEVLPAGVVWCSGWTPDGATLLLCAGDGTDGPGGSLVPVDTGTWQTAEPIDIGGSAQMIEASPDGRLLAVASAAAPLIVLLDAETLEVERTVELSSDDQLGDLSFSPDGGLLAAAGALGQLHLIDTTTWTEVGDPAAVHDAAVLQVEWLPDGRTVVTTGMDGTVSLFDVERGLVRARPLPASGEPGEGYAHVVPGATGELVVLSGNRAGRRYPLEPAVWLDEACAVVGRDLTRAEWDRYLPGRPYEPTCSGHS